SDGEADALVSNATAPHLPFRFFLLMATARPRGTTHVFSVPMPYNLFNHVAPARGELLGVWSLSSAGWSAPQQAPLFPPLCASWRPPPDGQPLLAEIFEMSIYGFGDGFTIPVELYDRYVGTEEYEVLRLLRDSYGLVFQTTATVYAEALRPIGAADACRLDVVALPKEFDDGLYVSMHSELSFFPWALDHYVLIVPAGAGKQRPVWYPLTAEYTPTVWAALAAVVLTMAACLYLARRDQSVQQVGLQTLSPLLGQPLQGGRPGSQTAVLGGWLLMCVVVAGGYSWFTKF
ncbi:Ionotropic receptor 265, partial [Frankliniella occidentalis]